MLRSRGGGRSQYTREHGSVNRLVGHRARLRWLPETSRSKHDTCVQRTVTPSSRRGRRVHNLLLRQVPISFTTSHGVHQSPSHPWLTSNLQSWDFLASVVSFFALKDELPLKGHLSITICDNLPPTISFLMLSIFPEYFPQNVQTTPDPPSPIGCTCTGWNLET